MSPPRPLLVIFAPMPPSESGIAHYAATLLPELEQHYSCVTVVDECAPAPLPTKSGSLIIRHREYQVRRSELGKVRHLFHVGNNPDHLYMLPHLAAQNGVVVLHDPSLHYLLSVSNFHGAGNLGLFRDIRWREHGMAGLVLATQAVEQGWSTDASSTDMPALSPVVSRANGVIVHSAVAARRVGRAFPEVPVLVIEHFAQAAGPDRISRRLLARERLGINPADRLLLTLGFINRSKRIPLLLDAVSKLRAYLPGIRCLIVGRDTHDGPPVHREIEDRGLGEVVDYRGFVDEETIVDYLDACDLLVNLRLPTQGETSGSVSRALGRGVCTVVNDNGWFAELPDDVVVKVPPVPDPHLLAGLLRAYLANSRRRSEVERRARAYARDHLSLDRVGDHYHAAIEAMHRPCRPPPAKDIMPRWAPPLTRKTTAAIADLLPPEAIEPNHDAYAGALWWTQGFWRLDVAVGDVLTFGPESLRTVLQASLDMFPGAKNAASRFGLFAGSLKTLLFGSPRLLEQVIGQLDIDEVLVLDVWQDEPPTDTVAQLAEMLPRLGLDITRVVVGIETSVEMALERPIPIGECCVVAVKRAAISGLLEAIRAQD